MKANFNRPLPPLPRIAMLSWFATVPCLDTRDGKLVHRALDMLEAWHCPLGLEPQPAGGGFALSLAHAPENAKRPDLSAFTLGTGKFEACVTLARGRMFFMARPNGMLTPEAKEARKWEYFLPVSARDLMILRDVLARYWSLDGAPPSPVGFDEFQLKFGPRNVSLAANLPFPEGSGPRTLRLATPDGTGQAVSMPRPIVTKKVWINPLGNVGNRALQYLTAAGIAQRVSGAEISNVFLDMWDRHEPAPRPDLWDSAGTGTHFHVDVEGLADCLNRGEVNAIRLEGYCFHLDHYPSRADCRKLLPAAAGTEGVTGFGPGELVCSIRSAEILENAHPNYFPLPPAYYAKLQEDCGLALVFFGQIGDDPYAAALRAAFPKARFVPGVNQNYDFEVLRRSCNVALSISTFAWLAAWLGEAARIYLPVGGMFNPALHPGQLYLPLEDPAYRYVLLPPVTAVNLYRDPARFWLMQDVVARQARFASPQELHGLAARAASQSAGKVRVRNFDSDYYAAANSNVANEVRALRTTALSHYLTVGHREGLFGRPFDPLFYADTYPDAAAAVALGHYPSLFAHFLEVGEPLGYAALP